MARAIIDRSMSPFCPGLSLQACPSPSADSLRKDIVARVEAGESEASILSRLYTNYGVAIRGAPESTGFGLVAWLAPGLLFVIGFGVLTRRLRTLSARAATPKSEKMVRDAPKSPSDGAPTTAERAALDELITRDA